MSWDNDTEWDSDSGWDDAADSYERPQFNSSVSRVNKVLIFATIAAGVVAWIAGKLFYDAHVGSMSRPLLIGAVFLILYVIAVAVVLLISIIRGSFEGQFLIFDSAPKIFLAALIGAAAVFFLATLFQLIYGLEFSDKSTDPTSFVFVIDDSGSMEQTDPNQLRYDAIPQILSGMPEGFPYAIYSFSNGAELVRAMAPVSEDIGDIPLHSEGGTEILNALKVVLDDHEKGVWRDDDQPRVILLSDGYSQDSGLFSSINKVLSNYAKDTISVSTVGLGDADDNLMEKIAKRTGGVYIDVADASSLATAMGEASKLHSSRDLVSYRPEGDKDALYAFLRILFLIILGLVVGGLLIVCYGREDGSRMSCIVAVVTAVAGALIMEFATRTLLDEKIAWFILWILIALTIALITKTQRIAPLPSRYGGNHYDDDQDYDQRSYSVEEENDSRRAYELT
jgi:hypothetical protein